MLTNKNILDIAIGLVFHGDQILITRRKPGAHLGSMWEFPGGKVEARETREAAVVRELKEETGLSVIVEDLFHREVAHYPERSVQLSFYNCRVEGRPRAAQPLQATALAWVKRSELGNYEFPSGNDQVLQKIMQIPTSENP